MIARLWHTLFYRRVAKKRPRKPPLTEAQKRQRRAEYLAYMLSPEWSAIRERALRRDTYRCRDCTAPAAHVHHLTYVRFKHERLSDLLSLCVACHNRRHRKRR